MAQIFYELTNVSDLTCFAAQEDGFGGWTLSKLPDGMTGVGGMYIILNSTAVTPNRYVGIAQDLGHRFTTRLASVCELGISAPALAKIYAFWGVVWTIDDGAKVWTKIADYSAPMSRVINKLHYVNLERLLIRFCMTKYTKAAGHTMTNNMLIKSAYKNPTGAAITVTLKWKYPMGGTDQEAYVWGAGESW